MRKFFILAVAAILPALTLAGCTEYYLTISNPNPAGHAYKMAPTTLAWQAVDVPEGEHSDLPHKLTTISLAWGAIKKTKTPKYCGRLDALERVRIRDNIFYGVFSLVTLGLARPLDIEYKCSTGQAESGTSVNPCSITNALDNVRIQQNFKNGALSLVTLGFVRPLNIEYKCFAGRTTVVPLE